MGVIVNVVAGLLFGLGLLISGLVDPAKVQNFLDLFGSWDPSLAFAMAGAVATTFLGYRIAWRRPAPLLAPQFRLPAGTSAIDRPLVLGAAIFGVGWGLTGFCPGPALVSIPLLAPGTLVFVPAMLAGIIMVRLLRTRIVPVQDGS
ncbi:MAG: YeeE/YedE family protein [Hyphomicrobium sp.]|uniref:DUF6691 family protein n=1 Tax=Hyphomicrobium sp. TaxID=82 RepID=UPI00132C4F2A|nr:DUF6691 family protein [Hyphomicrobium sp.]KAB2939493.1 MAG: YeeE/YedE family protein [Hyphomicrobium sp.]MBZ0208765.1 YeeE/YedE family protein [Hyphomicrobium sp.]MCZ7593513.1 YeeE/YedE family protein [Hyphomicrobium sp.]